MKGCVTFHNDIFTPWPATSIVHPVQVMLEAGHSVTVISWDKGRGVRPAPATLPVTRLSISVPVTSPLSLFRFSSRLRDELVAQKPDFIMAFDLEVLDGSARAARILNVPLLYFAREDWPAMVRGEGGFSSIIKSMMFARMEKRICRKSVRMAYSVNPERGEKFRKWGVPFTTIYTTRGLSELPPLPEKHGKFTVAFAGSMLELKALPSVLEAMRGLQCRLLLIGGDERNLEKALEITKSSSQVEVAATGHIPADIDYFTEIGRCHLGLTFPVNTDRNKYYGISVKFWDYMAMGLPQIASNFPAMARILKGGEEGPVGRTADPYSLEEIRQWIKYYLEHPDQADREGKAARRLFEKEYCWDVQKQKLIASHAIFRKD